MKKLHNHRSAPGLERVLLRKMPGVLLGAFVVPLLMSVIARLFPIAGTVDEIAKHQSSIDILGIAICIAVLTGLFVVFIGCILVVLMKGPAYVADAYDLIDSERPAPKKDDTEKT
jgi:hypothetical protein